MFTKLFRPVSFLCIALFVVTYLSISLASNAHAGAPAASTWVKSYRANGTDRAVTAVYSPARGLVVVADMLGAQPDSSDALLLHLDKSGALVSQKAYGMDDGAANTTSAMIGTPDGGYLIARITSNHTERELALLLKLDAAGQVEWQNMQGSYSENTLLMPQALGVFPDGGYLVIGKAYPPQDAWLMKLDAQGNRQWLKYLGAAGIDELHALVRTTDGFVLVGSASSGGSGKEDAWVGKIDFQGKLVWQNMFGAIGTDFASKVVLTRDGGYMVSGSTKPGLKEPSNGLLIRLDSSGKLVWQKLYSYGTYFSIDGLVATRDDSFVLVGNFHATSEPGTGSTEMWAIKIDGQGNPLWQHRYGGKDFDVAMDIIRMKKGYVILGGSSVADGALVMRLDADGNILPHCSFQKTFQINIATASTNSRTGKIPLTKQNQVPAANVIPVVTTPETTTTNICPP